MPRPAGSPPSAPSHGVAVRERAQAKVQPPSMWKVLLHNDDYTTQDFVVFILRQVFRKTEPEAVAIMLAVHQRGLGVAGVFPKDVAETKVILVKKLAEQREFPLLCTLEPEEVTP